MTLSLLPLLAKLAERGRVGSAYILTGSDADFLRKQATLFSKRLNCETENMCNACTHCQKIDRQTHPDILEIHANGEAIKLEPLKDLQKRIRLKRVEGKHKVIICDGAEYLHSASGNALLKILEEPPSKTVFLLLTPYLDRLLPTIVSRCQVIRAPLHRRPIPDNEFFDQLLTLPTSQEALFELAANLSEEDDTFHQCLDIWLAWYRTLLLHKQHLTPPDTHFHSKEELAKALAAQYSFFDIDRRMAVIMETKRKLQYQVRRDLLAEHLLIQLSS